MGIPKYLETLAKYRTKDEGTITLVAVPYGGPKNHIGDDIDVMGSNGVLGPPETYGWINFRNFVISDSYTERSDHTRFAIQIYNRGMTHGVYPEVGSLSRGSIEFIRDKLPEILRDRPSVEDLSTELHNLSDSFLLEEDRNTEN